MMDSNGLLFSMSIGCLHLISIGLTLGFDRYGFQYVVIGFNRSYVFQQVLRISIGCLQWVSIGLM